MRHVVVIHYCPVCLGKRFIAVRVAAMLADDPTLGVHHQSGTPGELRVEVDGETAITVPHLAYPRPRTLLHEVRTWLRAHAAVD